MKKRIICVGNRYLPEDDAGPRVYDILARNGLPAGVQAIDGGIAGLDLLRWIDGAEEIVFVDSVAGFSEPGSVVLLTAEEASESTEPGYGHAAGLACLLRVLPRVHEGELPRVTVVGIEAPADGNAVSRAARISVSLLTEAGGAHAPAPGEASRTPS